MRVDLVVKMIGGTERSLCLCDRLAGEGCAPFEHPPHATHQFSTYLVRYKYSLQVDSYSEYGPS